LAQSGHGARAPGRGGPGPDEMVRAGCASCEDLRRRCRQAVSVIEALRDQLRVYERAVGAAPSLAARVDKEVEAVARAHAIGLAPEVGRPPAAPEPPPSALPKAKPAADPADVYCLRREVARLESERTTGEIVKSRLEARVRQLEAALAQASAKLEAREREERARELGAALPERTDADACEPAASGAAQDASAAQGGVDTQPDVPSPPDLNAQLAEQVAVCARLQERLVASEAEAFLARELVEKALGVTQLEVPRPPGARSPAGSEGTGLPGPCEGDGASSARGRAAIGAAGVALTDSESDGSGSKLRPFRSSGPARGHERVELSALLGPRRTGSAGSADAQAAPRQSMFAPPPGGAGPGPSGPRRGSVAADEIPSGPRRSSGAADSVPSPRPAARHDDERGPVHAEDHLEGTPPGSKPSSGSPPGLRAPVLRRTANLRRPRG